MIEKLIEDITKEGINVSSFFILYEKYRDVDVGMHISIYNLEVLESKKLIKITNDIFLHFELRQLGIDIVEKLIGIEYEDIRPVKAVNKGSVEEFIKEWVDEYRILFKGLKSGSMGDKNACVTKFVKFYETYPEFANKDIILAATKKYINVEGMNRNYMYLQKAHYFIFKQESGKNTEVSNLASYCEEVGENINTVTSNILDLN